MQRFIALIARRSPLKMWILLLLCALGGVALGAVGTLLIGRSAVASAPTGSTASAGQEHAEEEHQNREVHLPSDKWPAAKIQMAPAERRSFTESSAVTGKVVLNDDRLAHIYSLVEGIVHEVRVPFGQQVKAGDVLAVIDSTAVGQAKLDLVKSRLQSRIADVNHGWNEKIYKNTQSLVDALEQETPISELERRYHDQPMGEYRQQLISAYARLHQARADYERLQELTDKGITSGADFIKANADYEAARATYIAWLEQIKFTSWQQFIQSQQSVEQAKMAEGVGRSALYVMGYREQEVARMDPLSEGEEVAHYEIRAPFDGTVILKDVVLEERVGPDTRLFDVADLSSVWVQADIFEKDLSLLAGLRNKELRFGSAAYPGREFYATVFYTGDIVDEKTRTVRMMALAENPEGLLKPGTFVEIELPTRKSDGVLQVAASAVLDDDGDKFVFVHNGGEEFERRDVKLGRQSPSAVEILAGLKEGESVVVQGAFALKTALLSESLGEGHAH